MIPGTKSKSITLLTIGLSLVGGATALLLTRENSAWTAGILYVVGVPLYLWGCAVLADGKGYTSAIIVTAPLGLLLPLVIIVALPDKLRQRSRRRRSSGNRPEAERPQAGEVNQHS